MRVGVLGLWHLGSVTADISRIVVTIHVHDPMAKELPKHWRNAVGAHVLVLATEWPIYRTFSTNQRLQCSNRLVILDANRFLTTSARADGRLRYFAVGASAQKA